MTAKNIFMLLLIFAGLAFLSGCAADGAQFENSKAKKWIHFEYSD